ncbi:MAG: hypothetical protein KY464_06470 [Gemmatimonadetes bacterium]|nr:hypothetical protein [Gemmatimonadota bacterium]
MRILLLLLCLVLAPTALGSQSAPAYADPVARELVAQARTARRELGRSITSYTAIVRQRSAAMLRMPLRDRLIDREESAARVRWSRDGETVVQVLAARSGERRGKADEGNLHDLQQHIFDPAGDRVYFALEGIGFADGDDDMWAAHPLADDSETYYRYESGDTMTVRLSGRTIRAVQLNVIPRTSSFHYFTAALWIEPESGALVQAVYRPARTLDVLSDTSIVDADDQDDLWAVPGFFKPMEVDFESIIVQYSLWDLRHWLPRLTRVEGHFRAGAVRVPFSQERSYEVEVVTDEAQHSPPLPSAEQVIAGWGGTVPLREFAIEQDSTPGRPRARVFAPRDLSVLAESEELPPPIWDDAPEFASDGELDSLVDALEKAVSRGSVASAVELDLQWGGAAGDLLRYNRVEGLSVGVRGTARHPLGSARATLRLGTADLTPNVELAATHPRWGRTLGLAVYHQLVAADPTALGIGNSASALLFGRDAGEYYRATGARFEIAPAAADRQWYRWSLFAERHGAVERGTVWSAARLLGANRDLRPNLHADAADLVGASLSLHPWWGHDPGSPQLGLEYFLEGATGDREFARSRLIARTIIPAGQRYRVGLEGGGGTSWGALPAQSHWFLGGSRTLRGYDPSAALGSSFLRARAEIARGAGPVGLAVFSDAAWAGEHNAFRSDDVLVSAGLGATFLQGLLRADVARALRAPTGWKLELYLDAVL